MSEPRSALFEDSFVVPQVYERHLAAWGVVLLLLLMLLLWPHTPKAAVEDILVAPAQTIFGF